MTVVAGRGRHRPADGRPAVRGGRRRARRDGRHDRRCATACASSARCGSTASGPNPQPLRPNILFILTDDQRWDTTDDTHSPGLAPDIMPGLRSELGGSGVEFAERLHDARRSAARAARASCAASTPTTPASTRTPASTAAPTTSSARAGDRRARCCRTAGYRTGFLGKYLNGYNQLSGRTRAAVRPAGLDRCGARFSNVRYFDYDPGRERRRRCAYGTAEADYSTDVLREKAKQFITDSVAVGEPFFLYLAFKAPHGPSSPAPRHVGMFAGLPPWRPASYNEADVSDKPTWVQNTAPAHADRAGRARRHPHRPARDAAGGRRGDRRQHDLRHHRHHAAPARPRHRRRHDRRLLRRQRLALGRAPLPGEEQALRGVDPRADVRPLSEARAAAARRRRSSRSTSTSARPSSSSRCARPIRSRRSPSTARAWCALLDGTAPSWRTDFLPRAGRRTTSWAIGARRRSGSTPSCR